MWTLHDDADEDAAHDLLMGDEESMGEDETESPFKKLIKRIQKRSHTDEHMKKEGWLTERDGLLYTSDHPRTAPQGRLYIPLAEGKGARVTNL